MWNYLLLILLFTLSSTSFAQTVDGPKFDTPTAGPPPNYFAAAGTIPVAALQNAAVKASIPASNVAYPINRGPGAAKVTMYSDWLHSSEGSAFVWIADMDVDCDGLNYQCEGNPDGQAQTKFGALSAYEVPFIVIPNEFGTAYQNILPGNNVGAVICNGNMFYGIYGDSAGDTPEVIGEASWLMARTCFPNDDLNGNRGHGNVDVTYILFTGSTSILPATAINSNYITNFTTLRSMGDGLMTSLASNLGLNAPAVNAVATSGSCSRTVYEAGSKIIMIMGLVLLADIF